MIAHDRWALVPHMVLFCLYYSDVYICFNYSIFMVSGACDIRKWTLGMAGSLLGSVAIWDHAGS